MTTEFSVFINYSHDSIEHKDWVVNFAKTLKLVHGIPVLIDTDAAYIRLHEHRISTSKVVICIVTDEYVKRFNSGDLNTGVGRERAKLFDALLQKDTVTIEVKRNSTMRPDLFKELNCKYFDFSGEGSDLNEKMLKDLVNYINKQYPCTSGIDKEFPSLISLALLHLETYFDIKSGDLKISRNLQNRTDFKIANTAQLVRDSGEINAIAYKDTPWKGTTHSFETNKEQKIVRNNLHFLKNKNVLSLLLGKEDGVNIAERYIGYFHILPINYSVYLDYVGSNQKQGSIQDNLFHPTKICSLEEYPYSLILFGIGCISKSNLSSSAELFVYGLAKHLETFFDAYPDLQDVKLICQNDNDNITAFCKYLGMNTGSRKSGDGEYILETTLRRA